MTGRYQTYPEYKESGVEWINTTPSHWSRVPLKYMATEKDSLFLDGDWIESKDISSNGIRYITTGNVGKGKYKEQGAGYISENKFHEIGCTEVFEGDLLISRLNAPIGRSCIVPNLNSRIVTSVDNVVFRPDKIYSKRFLVYLFSCKQYFMHTGILARGATMQRISRGLLGNIRTPLPPLKEQHQIARFLDYETTRIDQLIAKQERLIELLKEKRQAVISHAVTKGLDPDAPMKDSGVEWLGEVPKSWLLIRFRHSCSHIFLGLTSKVDYVEEGGVPLVRLSNIQGGKLDLSNARYISKNQHGNLTKNNRVQRNDVLLGKSGAVIGTTAIVDTDIEFSIYESLFALRSQMISPAYLAHLVRSQSCLNQFGWSASVGMGIGHLNMADILDVYVAIPPTVVQETIVSFLNKEVCTFDKLTDKANRAIDLMYERRTALISAAVTGKIDVRNWEPPTTNDKDAA